jgi:predicted alpha/beta hydrolase family esterase/GNAT superfamily N-acetyltransferase
LLLLPGLYDSGPEHWQSQWERSLPLAGRRVQRVVQRDWVTPDCTEWVHTLNEAVVQDEDDSGVLLAAHSTACPTVAHWARSASLPELLRVRGALLVAPSDPTGAHYPSGPTGFAPVPLDALPFPCTVVASRNDPYLSFDTASQYARSWGATFVDAGNAGHLNTDAGFGPWPEGLALLDRLAAMPRIRLATTNDLPAMRALIDASVRALSASYYTPQEIDRSLERMFGVDTQLLDDGTYFVVTTGDTLLACGGWSARRTLFGGDQHKRQHADGADTRLDPAVDAARIRAFFVHPSAARQGLARRLYTLCAHEARRAGFGALELLATLPGVPLYTALGFTRGEPVRVPLGDALGLDCVVMRRTL